MSIIPSHLPKNHPLSQLPILYSIQMLSKSKYLEREKLPVLQIRPTRRPRRSPHTRLSLDHRLLLKPFFRHLRLLELPRQLSLPREQDRPNLPPSPSTLMSSQMARPHLNPSSRLEARTGRSRRMDTLYHHTTLRGLVSDRMANTTRLQTVVKARHIDLRSHRNNDRHSHRDNSHLNLLPFIHNLTPPIHINNIPLDMALSALKAVSYPTAELLPFQFTTTERSFSLHPDQQRFKLNRQTVKISRRRRRVCRGILR